MDDRDGDMKAIDRCLGWHRAAFEKACGDLVGLVGDIEGNPLECRQPPGRSIRVASHGLV